MERRRDYHGSRSLYTEGEPASLLDDVRDFADEWQKRKAQDAMIQAGPLQMSVKGDAVERESMRQLAADGSGGGVMVEWNVDANSALITVMLRSAMSPTRCIQLMTPSPP